MGDVLAELEAVLKSKPPEEKLTRDEEAMLGLCKGKAIRAFTFSACASSAAVWIACRSLSRGERFNLSLGSAILAGLWRFDKSLNSCVEHILAFEGSRMQRELANIILRKYQYNTWNWKVKLVHKHFYPEQVFTDINPDQPFLRWRSRNSYVENSATQNTEDLNTEYDHEKSDPNLKPSIIPAAMDMISDPLDCIFGSTESSSEITYSGKDASTLRRQNIHKRTRRRHHHAYHPET